MGKFVLLAALVSSLTFAPLASAQSKALAQGKTAPPFELKDANGTSIKLGDFKGRVVLLNFWATWCAPCKVMMPWYQEFENSYGDRGFSVVAVSLDEDGWKPVKRLLEEQGLKYPVVLDENEKVGRLYGDVDSLPTTFLIDSVGKIASVRVGLVTKERLARDIERLLGAN